MSQVRIGNTQRTEVLDRLNRALDERSLPLDEYDRRVATVATASNAGEWVAPLADLPEKSAWQPHPEPPPVAPPGTAGGSGRTALVLGLVSLPLSLCAIGWITGILAMVYSRRGATAGRAGMALVGRV